MTYHVPVLLDEVLETIQPDKRMTILDCTLGAAGHSSAMLARMPEGGRLYGIDRDGEAIREASRIIAEKAPQRAKDFTALRGNFFDAKKLLAEQSVTSVDAILADLGVSSHQFDDGERGFSHRTTARLDMRMDRSAPLTAYNIVNGYGEAEIRKILFDYGEEKFAPSIARNIVKARAEKPVETTTELVEIIKASMPAKVLREKGHPAARTFQALRIATNGELDGLDKAIRNLADLLTPGGVIAIITFHSLEDRIVKNVFREMQNPCICPKDAPVCICGKKPVVEILLRKPVTASDDELEKNPRSRSAKLRAARKI